MEGLRFALDRAGLDRNDGPAELCVGVVMPEMAKRIKFVQALLLGKRAVPGF